MRVLAVSNAALSSAHFGVGQLRDDAETAATTDPGAFNSRPFSFTVKSFSPPTPAALNSYSLFSLLNLFYKIEN